MIFVNVKELPPTLQSILKAHGYHRKDIGIEAKEAFYFSSAFGDGYRAFATLVNLETGETKTFTGGWGGGYAGAPSQVDADHSPHLIPVNAAVITGQEGGGRPVSATVIVRPDAITKFLPPVPHLGNIQRTALRIFRSYKAFARPEYLAREEVSKNVIEGLINDGFLKRNKAGAISITTAGKNAVANDRGF